MKMNWKDKLIKLKNIVSYYYYSLNRKVEKIKNMQSDDNI